MYSDEMCALMYSDETYAGESGRRSAGGPAVSSPAGNTGWIPRIMSPRIGTFFLLRFLSAYSILLTSL